MEAVKKFEVGGYYYTRSICDHNCIFAYEVTKRTAKTVTIRDKFGKEKGRRKICIMDGEETISPEGSYSMSPTVGAGDVLPGIGTLRERADALSYDDMERLERERLRLRKRNFEVIQGGKP